MNLIFVRHGQSVWNLENKFTGWVDVGLSENGVKEASNAGDLLINEKFIPDICFTSFLKRSIDTADILLNKYENKLNKLQQHTPKHTNGYLLICPKTLKMELKLLLDLYQDN